MDPISMNSYSGYNAFSNAQSGINSNIQSATLETSNTDLTQSTANTIAAQNGVEANAQSIQTADSMYQSLLDIMA
ncbi:flagellar basal body rod C-terminal domain-containing protein [Helicobacter pullorum]|uniref:flagellar basal body rod C-terminal domain-containing protein n=1 Tax=Helicobacter pullorum TaxID=35818 RepID=UPI000CF0C518|nr:flagellar basal body rod C-terminal domain-containing protein [Helicobacter pullorum]